MAVLMVALPPYSLSCVFAIAIIFHPESEILVNRELLRCRQSRSSPDGALELCPGQQISKAGLQKFCFGLVVCSGGMSYVRDQDDALRGLIGRQAFAFLTELCDLSCHADHVPGLLELVVATLDGDGDLFFQVLKILLGLGELRG